ncbi:MAG: hypothetical protein AAFN79_10080 [Pseudomonadota bacterium]
MSALAYFSVFAIGNAMLGSWARQKTESRFIGVLIVLAFALFVAPIVDMSLTNIWFESQLARAPGDNIAGAGQWLFAAIIVGIAGTLGALL